MTMNSRETPDKIIVSFAISKILDEARIQEIGKSLLGVCKQASGAGKRLIVDFRGVSFMSSAMIGKLVLLHKLAKQKSVDLRVANVSGNVLEVFKITRLRFDDDDPDLLGSGVPLPKPPGTLGGCADPPPE